MSSSYQAFSKEGDYFMEGNEGLTRDLLSRQSPAVSDLANICLRWYKIASKKKSISRYLYKTILEK